MDNGSETPYGSGYDAAVWAHDWNQAMQSHLDQAEATVEEETPAEKVLKIDGFFHTHDFENMQKLERFKEGIVSQLEESEGNVLVALELANLTQEASDEVYRLVAEGQTVRSALKQVLKPEPGKESGLVYDETKSDTAKQGDEASGNDLLAQIKVLDSIITDPKYKGRVRVLLEGRPKADLENDEQFIPVIKYSTQDLADRTSFSRVVTRFQQVVAEQAELTYRRDQAFSRRVAERINDKGQNIDGCVILFGSSHSNLNRELPRQIDRKTSTSYTFLQKDGTQLWFSPYDQLLQRVLLHTRKTAAKTSEIVSNADHIHQTVLGGVNSIESVYWYKALFALRLKSKVDSFLKKEKKTIPPEEYEARLRGFMRQFEDEDSFLKFCEQQGMAKAMHYTITGEAKPTAVKQPEPILEINPLTQKQRQAA